MPAGLRDKTEILADDGIATCNTMLSAIEMLIRDKAKEIIVAIPIASRSAIRKINSYVNVLIWCLTIPDNFCAVSQVYESFEQVSDEEVVELLKRANGREGAGWVK
jgi:putative phosphoribosyl transferase